MNVIEIKNETLALTQRPIPEPTAHQVLIKVAAAGVNRPDIMPRKGRQAFLRRRLARRIF